MSERTRLIFSPSRMVSARRSPRAPVPESWMFPWESRSSFPRSFTIMGVPSLSEMPSETAMVHMPCWV